MATSRWATASAQEICGRFALSEQAGGPPLPADTPAGMMARLATHGAWVDGLRVLAYGLSKRDAIWWGCVCYRMACPDPGAALEEETLAAVVRWVREPSEAHRREGELLQQTDTVAGCLALAVFFSSGSIGAPELPAVPAHPDATPRAVAGALILASTLQGPQKTPELRRQFVETGLEIAEGQHLWTLPS